jgi:predicted ATPase
LNFDYLRKTAPGYKPDPWDTASDGTLYPFVRIALESDVTAIVGANESGKSQVLAAIKGSLSGEGFGPRDFCRYSSFFSDAGLVVPEFGVRFRNLGNHERRVAAEMCEIDVPTDVTEAAIFRMNNTPKLRLYLRSNSGEWSEHRVKKPTELNAFGMPKAFEIDSSVPLPDAVSLEFLVTGTLSVQDNPEARRGLIDTLISTGANWLSSADAIRQNADAIAETLDRALADEKVVRQQELAADLLLKVVGLDRALFVELQNAVSDGIAGYAGSLVDTVNDKLSKRLNLPHWWSQDSKFDLRVELRDRMLAFVIGDRTGSTYSFDERSQGLKYFLSYYVQHLSHEPPEDGHPEILLMDEPDAYLSASGQQDLLRIFEAFAHPDDGTRPIQVVYVTHSPFLIDKNHAERVRVLEKGEYEEGTRVVANASRNHYEPLRSAFGSFVGETTFMGTCNIVLEGASDQIVIAGLTSWLLSRGAPTSQRLDLNTLTLVPAGGASHVPYIAYLACGRDVDRPAVIVLLDGDKDGDLAKAGLERGGPRGKELVPSSLVLQLSDLHPETVHVDNPRGCRTIEDLVPFGLVVEAARRYCREFVPEANTEGFAPSALDAFAGDVDTHKAVQAALRSHVGNPELELNKIGLARSIVAVIREVSVDESDLGRITQNFRELFEQLGRRQRRAERMQGGERISGRINRIRRIFQTNHPSGARREDVTLLIEEVENQLDSDSSLEADQVRLILRTWVRDFCLDDEMGRPVDDWERFRAALDGLAYAGTQAVQDPLLSQVQDETTESVALTGTAKTEDGEQTILTGAAENTESTAVAESPPETNEAEAGQDSTALQVAESPLLEVVETITPSQPMEEAPSPDPATTPAETPPEASSQ